MKGGATLGGGPGFEGREGRMLAASCGAACERWASMTEICSGVKEATSAASAAWSIFAGAGEGADGEAPAPTKDIGVGAKEMVDLEVGMEGSKDEDKGVETGGVAAASLPLLRTKTPMRMFSSLSDGK